jgi:hypothetical protein
MMWLIHRPSAIVSRQAPSVLADGAGRDRRSLWALASVWRFVASPRSREGPFRR